MAYYYLKVFASDTIASSERQRYGTLFSGIKKLVAGLSILLLPWAGGGELCLTPRPQDVAITREVRRPPWSAGLLQPGLMPS